MIIFWLLLLAHLLADFPLQTYAIFSQKKSSKWGVMPHIIVYAATNISIFLPFLKNIYFLVGIFFLIVIHGLIDRVKLILTRPARKDTTLAFFLDQAIHVIILVFVYQWLKNHFPDNELTKWWLYQNPQYIAIFCGLIISVFSGTIIIHYVVLDVERFRYKNPSLTIPFPKGIDKYSGYLERFIATSTFLLGGGFVIASFLIFLPRAMVDWKHKEKRIIFIETLLGCGISITVGLFLKIYLHF